jgi:8-oxo-dGTP pyrophosphatase MutT (NUDIX family)
MDKFSNIQKGMKKEMDSTEKLLYKGDVLSIIGYKDWEFVKEGDMVVVLPYLRDEANIILRHEWIPTYQYHYKDHNDFKRVTHFLTVLTGTVEPGETLQNTIRRELYEEAGIVLSNVYEIEINKHLFLSKGNTSQYHTCIVELRYNDFRLTAPKGDGSYGEKISNSVKISLGDLDDIRTHDLITEYMLTKFKLDYLK